MAKLRQAFRTCSFTIYREDQEVKVTLHGYPLGDEEEDGYEFDHASDSMGRTVILTGEELSDADQALNS